MYFDLFLACFVGIKSRSDIISKHKGQNVGSCYLYCCDPKLLSFSLLSENKRKEKREKDIKGATLISC